ncbi:hypothetical protein [Streptomyces mangrovi]|uniref:hypothetical protein n=1 Tax=Streptomyces mangrovi TaxID=1206892 RepID=UPI00399CCBB5
MAMCSVCGGELPAQRGPRARRYCSRACQAKAYRARQRQGQERRTAPEEERELMEAYAGVAATELADSLAAAARRLAGALSAGEPPSASDLKAVVRIPAVLAARARQGIQAVNPQPGSPDHSGPLAVADSPDPRPAQDGQSHGPRFRNRPTEEEPRRTAVQSPPPQAPRDDSVAPPPEPTEAPRGGTPAKTAPARRKRLSQKAARSVADSARLTKNANHRDNHRWDLIAEDGTVLGYVEPSYGGTGRTGRNGWNYRLADSFAVSGPYRTREEAAVQCALAWIRVVTAPVRRTLTGD